MPATIEVLQKTHVKAIEDNELPLLATNGDNIYLILKKESDKYNAVYISDKSGNPGTLFGELFNFESIKQFCAWDGSVNIENN